MGCNDPKSLPPLAEEATLSGVLGPQVLLAPTQPRRVVDVVPAVARHVVGVRRPDVHSREPRRPQGLLGVEGSLPNTGGRQ